MIDQREDHNFPCLPVFRLRCRPDGVELKRWALPIVMDPVQHTARVRLPGLRLPVIPVHWLSPARSVYCVRNVSIGSLFLGFLPVEHGLVSKERVLLIVDMIEMDTLQLVVRGSAQQIGVGRRTRVFDLARHATLRSAGASAFELTYLGAGRFSLNENVMAVSDPFAITSQQEFS